jgi:thiamine transport system ATP-binding protein
MLEVDSVSVVVDGQSILDRVNLAVGDGETVAVLGPSGAGKSTLLRVVAGLRAADSGRVRWNGSDLGAVPPHRRKFGLMFQDYALFPHLDVAGNVGFGLRMAGATEVEAAQRVTEVLEWVGLPDFERRAVTSLSGGEQQRVALARSLAPSPRLLMLDEPLGSLDRGLAERLVLDLRHLLLRKGVTALYVTHDQEEAFTVADRLAVIRDGRVVREGRPEEIWEEPGDAWLARFLGFANLAESVVTDGVAVTPWGKVTVPKGAAGEVVMLRADRLLIRPDGTIAGTVAERLFQGSQAVLRVDVDGSPPLQVEVPARESPRPGDAVRVAVPEHAVSVLRADPRESALPQGHRT